MAQIHTHYDNLKVARDAPPEVIRAAYKILSQKHHPDRHGNSAEAIRIIQLINSAYEVLSDPIRRQEHDDWIAKAEASGTHHRGAGHVRTRNTRHSHSGMPFHVYHSHRSSQVARAVQTAVLMWDHFCRKVFRKI